MIADEKRKRILDAVVVGRANTLTAIALREGVDVRTIYRILEDSGEPERRYFRIDPEAAAQMVDSGASVRDIAEKFGVTRQAVYVYLARSGKLCAYKAAKQAQSNKRKAAEQERRRALDERRPFIDNGMTMGYREHRNARRLRGEPYHLTFEQYVSIWQASGKWQDRKSARYCLAKNDFDGEWTAENVSVQTFSEFLRRLRYWRKNQRRVNTGVYMLYPGSSRPWVAKIGNRLIGSFASESAAVKARVAEMATC